MADLVTIVVALVLGALAATAVTAAVGVRMHQYRIAEERRGFRRDALSLGRIAVTHGMSPFVVDELISHHTGSDDLGAAGEATQVIIPTAAGPAWPSGAER